MPKQTRKPGRIRPENKAETDHKTAPKLNRKQRRNRPEDDTEIDQKKSGGFLKRQLLPIKSYMTLPHS